SALGSKPCYLLLLWGQGCLWMTAGSKKKCSQQKGFCMFWRCPFGYKFVGLCSTFSHCCKIIWG
uniref:Beta-defensin-like domain-containing protein n=1 Tax=Accipiter nisus TaxID=211598 RepID=A0A8B9N1S7_9AVES